MKIKDIIPYIKQHKKNIATVIIVLFISMIITRDVIHACIINFDIAKLEREKTEYQLSITRDSTLIELLKNDEELVRYAREKFYMKRDKEDIFIIE